MQLKKVARLMDLYIVEVAPDPCIKPSKFLALDMSLPDSARDSHDEMYHAMDIYLKVVNLPHNIFNPVFGKLYFRIHMV